MIAAVALLLVVVAAIQVWRPKSPLRLADTIQRGRSPWAARQDQRAATPPKRGWGGGFSYDQRRRIKQTTRRLAPVLCLVLVCCSPAQRAASEAGAKKAALSFAACEAEQALPSLGAWVGARLGDSQWQETGGHLLTGQFSQAMACALRSLALSIPSVDARPTAPEMQRLQSLAEQCPGGACDDVRLRAAWLLWREYHDGRLRLPPSGQG